MTGDVIHIVHDVKKNGKLFKKRDMKNYNILKLNNLIFL